jgi:predicted MFS family arabinose efflux permease
MKATIYFATAIGSAAVGIGIVYAGFSATLALITVISVIMLIPALMLWKANRKDLKIKDTQRLAQSRKINSKLFWLVSLAMVCYSFATYPLIKLILPVFMSQQLGYNNAAIGIAFMFFNLILASVAFIALKRKICVKRAVLQTLIMLVATFMVISSDYYFLAFFLALALANGLAIEFYEFIIAKVTKDTSYVSLNIGILSIPTRLAEFTSVIIAGFIVQYFGYLPVFATAWIFFTAFSLTALYVFKSPLPEARP